MDEVVPVHSHHLKPPHTRCTYRGERLNLLNVFTFPSLQVCHPPPHLYPQSPPLIAKVSIYWIGIIAHLKGFYNGKSLCTRSSPASQAGPNGWLTAVGLSTSSLSTAISSICLQFPHSSSTPSEVHSDRFPTPPPSRTVRPLHYRLPPMKREAAHIHRTGYRIRIMTAGQVW